MGQANQHLGLGVPTRQRWDGFLCLSPLPSQAFNLMKQKSDRSKDAKLTGWGAKPGLDVYDLEAVKAHSLSRFKKRKKVEYHAEKERLKWKSL